jgi:hypothetical protein
MPLVHGQSKPTNDGDGRDEVNVSNLVTHIDLRPLWPRLSKMIVSVRS